MIAWEMHVGQGWRQIVRAVVSAIERSGGEVSDVKEKFGLLRIYHHGGTDQLDAYVDAAESISGLICENCGMPGYSRDMPWIKTLCDECHDPQELVLTADDDVGSVRT